jgi:hypothetical protein
MQSDAIAEPIAATGSTLAQVLHPRGLQHRRWSLKNLHVGRHSVFDAHLSPASNWNGEFQKYLLLCEAVQLAGTLLAFDGNLPASARMRIINNFTE